MIYNNCKTIIVVMSTCFDELFRRESVKRRPECVDDGYNYAMNSQIINVE